MFGAILGAGTALLGGVLSHKANKSQHNDQMALANAQVQFQQDYAKNRLQWQAEDAKKAGFHPMVAAGLSPTSFSPVSYPTSSPTDYSWVSNIGQNLDYAATKAKTGQQMSQAAQLMQQSQEAVVDGQELDNELKRMEIEAMRARLANAGPVAPTSNAAPGVITGQDDSLKTKTGLISPETSSYHVWDMGDGNFDILMNPDYQQTIGDEFGQVATTLKGITRAKQGVWVNPEDGVSYVFDAGSGYFRRLSSLSNEEARRLLGSGSARTSGLSPTHRERNKYRYR